MSGLEGMAVIPAPDLLERESELGDLERALAAARAGDGRLVLVQGPAGIGKTALLAALRSLAEADGMAVARARGKEFESAFAFGVVRQLFEPLVHGSRGEHRAPLLRGHARSAGGVLAPGDESPVAGTRLGEVMHGLYWLMLNLAERAPLLAVIDDAHWADPPSLRFLDYLAGRLEGVPVLTVAANRHADRGAAFADELAVLERTPGTRLLTLGPLSAPATADLVGRAFGEDVAPVFARACHRATGGNPFLLHELVRALRADGIAPTAAEVERVAQEGPASVARSALTRIAGLSPAAPAVARALALLGGEASLRDLAGLSLLDEDEAATAADLLVGAGIVVGNDPFAFAHPIVNASIYADIPLGERARAHRRAARLLADTGAPAERVAAQLLHTRPVGDPWAANVLSQASSQALARGAPDSAIAYLNRGLDEPPATGDQHRLSAQLGRAQYLAHRPGAAARLIEAMDTATRPAERGELALQAAKALIMSEPDRSEDAIKILDRAIPQLGEHDEQLSMRLEAQLLAAAGLKLSTRGLHRERMNRVYARALGDGPGERLLLANLASWTLIEGRTPGHFRELTRHGGIDGPPAEVARGVAERAIANGALVREEGSDSELFYLPILTLCYADRLDRAQYWLQEAIQDAQRRGSVVGYAQASAGLAEVAYRRGELSNAEAHAHAAATVSKGDALAVLINIMVEQGRLEEAQRMLEPYRLAPPLDHFMMQPIHVAEARLKIAEGRTREGAQQLLASGEWLETWGAKNPGVIPWRSSAALALDQRIDFSRARGLAAEEVALARALGQPRTLGIALRALGLLEPSGTGIDLLEQAISEFEESPARLEHARALIDYGGVLRRRGHRADARQPLREGLDLAYQCGATALSERARQELLAAGARPRRPRLSGRDALTPTEARVADLAAQGLTTPQIAQTLFVTPKTVGTHLGHAYQKLNIHSRQELADALSQPQNV